MPDSESKYSCHLCNYQTDRPHLYKAHLKRKKHINNMRKTESSITIDITKFEPEKEEINLEIVPDKKEEDINESIQFLKSLDDKIKTLTHENFVLKLHTKQIITPKPNPTQFKSVFDNDFSLLFQ